MIVVMLIIYALSALFVWNWLKIAYSKDGVWRSIKPDSEDLLITFFPVVNTIAILVLILESPFEKRSINKKPSKFKVKINRLINKLYITQKK